MIAVRSPRLPWALLALLLACGGGGEADPVDVDRSGADGGAATTTGGRRAGSLAPSAQAGGADGPAGGEGLPLRPLGATCKAKGDCDSGFCVDGVCCNLACTGGCLACNLPGRIGQCAPSAAGALDPRGVCKRESAESCGYSGTCDGFGGCAKHPAKTPCRAASCSGGKLVPAGVCDGNGACLEGSAIDCAPFACAAGACGTSCRTSGDCAGGASCEGGSCGKRGEGQRCAAASDCRSNFCVDGVCCESACAGSCTYCAYPNALGRCVAVAAGVPDPRTTCQDRGPGACGTNGRCDGKGACQSYPEETACRPESCDPTANLAQEAGVCRAGVCTGASRSCGAYRCGGAQCAVSCASNAACASPHVCREGRCVPPPSLPLPLDAGVAGLDAGLGLPDAARGGPPGGHPGGNGKDKDGEKEGDKE